MAYKCRHGHALKETKLGKLQGWVHTRVCKYCLSSIERSAVRYHCSSCEIDVCKDCVSQTTSPRNNYVDHMNRQLLLSAAGRPEHTRRSSSWESSRRSSFSNVMDGQTGQVPLTLDCRQSVGTTPSVGAAFVGTAALQRQACIPDNTSSQHWRRPALSPPSAVPSAPHTGATPVEEARTKEIAMRHARPASCSLSTTSTASNTPRNTPRSDPGCGALEQPSRWRLAQRKRFARVNFASQAEWIFYEDEEDVRKVTRLSPPVRFDDQGRRKWPSNMRATWCPLGCNCVEHGGISWPSDVPRANGHCPYQKPSPEFRRAHQHFQPEGVGRAAIVGEPLDAMRPASPRFNNAFVPQQCSNSDFTQQHYFSRGFDAQQRIPRSYNDFIRQQSLSRDFVPQQGFGSSSDPPFQTRDHYGTWASQQSVPIPINAVFPNAQGSRRLLTVI